jgi:hypothetical protein
MSELIDNVARILATPMPRRKAMKLFGGALAAAVVAFAGTQSVKAACGGGTTACGASSLNVCCSPGTCCTSNGSTQNPKAACCSKGQCMTGGTCSASNAGSCSGGATLCT